MWQWHSVFGRPLLVIALAKSISRVVDKRQAEGDLKMDFLDIRVVHSSYFGYAACCAESHYRRLWSIEVDVVSEVVPTYIEQKMQVPSICA